ncbi:1-(5-phosphoribosyl)-5-[(5-phosphoribosylamino)methylideneamino]imidazole-4-carboxamide isomerase [Candidatus Margulisiibacteriota bacterium]
MFKVIPAIDILSGNCVRLTKGDYTQETTYDMTPLEQAKIWEKLGAKKIHIVDLDGAKLGHPVNSEIIIEIAKKTACQIQVGGGIRSISAIKTYLEAGVNNVILGSVLFKDLNMLLEALKTYGHKIIAGIDLDQGQAKVSGWLENTRKDGLRVIIQLIDFGLSTFVITDIAMDGLLRGPNLDLYQKFSKHPNINIIASGGVTSLSDIENLKKIPNITGCIVGKALYEHKIDLKKALELEE